MTGRDRMVAIAIGVLVVLGGVWLTVVSPKRQQASQLSAQVSSAQSSLSAAEGQLASARTAQAQYAAAYASIVSLGKAVPASAEVPSLIYQIEAATNAKKIEFASIVAGSGTGAAATSTSSSSSSSASSAPVVSASFSALPFTFTFNGSYFDLEHLFESLNRFTLRTTAGSLQVSGRLLTVQSVKLAPVSGAGETKGHAASELSGTITASAYVLPASQGLTAGATPTSPTGASTPASSTTSGASSTTAPAIARVTP